MLARRLPFPVQIIGVVVVGLVLGVVGLSLSIPSRGLPFQNNQLVTAAFLELPPGLSIQSDVRVSGRRVGKIQSITYEQDSARAVLRVPKGLKVYRDATARIRSRSNVGQKYVQIEPGTPAAGLLGETVIPKERTRSQVEIDQVLDALDPKTRGSLAAALRELGGGVGGHQEDLADFLAAAPDLVADLGQVTGALSDDDAQLKTLLGDADRLLGRFAGRQYTLEHLSARLATTLSALDSNGALREAVARLPGTLDALTPAVGELGRVAAGLTPPLAELRPGAAALGTATPDLREVLRTSPAVLGKVPGIADLALPAVEQLTTALRDARPLAPALRKTVAAAAGLLGGIAPYAPELTLLLDRLASVLAQGDAHGHWIRVAPVAEPDSQTPGIPPEVRRNPYPEPGEASTDGRPKGRSAERAR